MHGALAQDPTAFLKRLFKSSPPVQSAEYSKQVIQDEAKYILQVG